jgi:HPt (histidine-containing phosphotransfer) domain-containing protein
MHSLDLSAALKATDGDVELLGDVIQAFLEEYPSLLTDIERGVQTNDCKVVQRASHTIKGTLRLFGNTQARDLAQQLEETSQAGTLTGAQSLSQSLQTALATLRSQLDEAYKSLTSGN